MPRGGDAAYAEGGDGKVGDPVAAALGADGAGPKPLSEVRTAGR